MEKEWICPFCGSNERVVDTPYVERVKEWPMKEYKPIKAFCCKWQRANADYLKRFDAGHSAKFGGKVPTLDEVAKDDS